MSMLEMCIFSSGYKKGRSKVLSVSAVTDVLCFLSYIRLSVPVDGEVISLYCSPVTKTVALQLADRRILKYLWGKLGPVTVPGLRCS